MRIYWYWPHPHRVASDLALHTLRSDDLLTVQALPSLHGESFEPISEYEVIRNLPDPTETHRWRCVDPARRIGLTVGRSRARRSELRIGYDVAHLHLLVYQTDWAEPGALSRRAPLVSSVHDVRPHRSQLPSSVERLLLQRTYERAGHLVVYHDVLRRELIEDFDVEPDRVHVVPPTIAQHDLRDPDVVSPDRPMLLLFGSLRVNKGIDVLLDAIEQFGNDFPGEVLIAGHGTRAMESAIASRVERFDHVRAEFGFVSPTRKRELYSAATAVLMPYTSFHSQSTVLSDAYSYRRPVIVSDVGALGPSVREHGTGLIVAPGDPVALATSIDAVLSGRLPHEIESRIEHAVAAHAPAAVGPRLRAVYDVAGER